jgi:hypothetical protein
MLVLCLCYVQHCAFPDCGQLDFLPFKCGCGQTFCLEHRTAAAHNCKATVPDCKQVIVCPICAQVRGILDSSEARSWCAAGSSCLM